MEITLLRDLLTIVIPSKNEGINLYNTVASIAKQYLGIGTKVIIADCSDDRWSLEYIEKIKTDFRYSLNIEIIRGGYPAYGRYVGAKMVTTDYVLFLDADVILKDKKILYDTINKTKDLSTIIFATDAGFNWIYDLFYLTQVIMKIMGTSFAIGGFQLFRTEAYKEVGGYKWDQIFAEDYYVSNKINPKRFTINRTKGVYTSARRFKNKGLFYMIHLMIKCWLNRNNELFYLKSHGYWD